MEGEHCPSAVQCAGARTARGDWCPSSGLVLLEHRRCSNRRRAAAESSTQDNKAEGEIVLWPPMPCGATKDVWFGGPSGRYALKAAGSTHHQCVAALRLAIRSSNASLAGEHSRRLGVWCRAVPKILRTLLGHSGPIWTLSCAQEGKIGRLCSSSAHAAPAAVHGRLSRQHRGDGHRLDHARDDDRRAGTDAFSSDGSLVLLEWKPRGEVPQRPPGCSCCGRAPEPPRGCHPAGIARSRRVGALGPAGRSQSPVLRAVRGNHAGQRSRRADPERRTALAGGRGCV